MEARCFALTLEPQGTCQAVTLESTLGINPLPQIETIAGAFEACEQSVFEINGTLSGASPWQVVINGQTTEIENEEMMMQPLITSDSVFIIEGCCG
ncbi:MAG: hypothetical protein U5L09_16440 [Bacteroidales bacterium]|nr:hypothetical protein [Bacteroidales bacterium]